MNERAYSTERQNHNVVAIMYKHNRGKNTSMLVLYNSVVGVNVDDYSEWLNDDYIGYIYCAFFAWTLIWV